MGKGESYDICINSGAYAGKMFKASVDACNKKRKMDSEWLDSCKGGQKTSCNPSIGVELHMTSPLPPEWEQCLDLQSGRIYYSNRSTQKKTWQDPRGGEGNMCELSKSLRLDLELNLPFKTEPDCESPTSDCSSSFLEENSNRRSEMIAVACAQCHMFVMLSKACPLCPNCKYVHPTDRFSFSSNDKKGDAPARQTLRLLDYGIEPKSNKPRKDDE